MITVRLGSDGPEVVLSRWGGGIAGDEHDEEDARRLLRAARPDIDDHQIEAILRMSRVVDVFSGMQWVCDDQGLTIIDTRVKADEPESVEVRIGFTDKPKAQRP